MRILTRYLLRQNAYIFGLCMGLGVSIYLLVDIVERVDKFLGADVGIEVALAYFIFKLPLIITQILPAVFLIAMVIQMGLLQSSRELTALQAGGISFLRVASFFLVYSVLLSGLHLIFSQYIGVIGEAKTEAIWDQDVRNREASGELLEDIWFKEGLSFVRMDRVWPESRRGEGITVFSFSPQGERLTRVVRARRFRVEEGVWILDQAREFVPEDFLIREAGSLNLPLAQDPEAFSVLDANLDPEQLSLWRLSSLINQLHRTGSNVESLRTAWHMKFSYSFSMVAMALIAMTVSSFGRNLFVNVLACLFLTFVFYVVYMMGTTAGQNGVLPPIAGAWLGNMLVWFLSGTRLVWISLSVSR
jgi:lipopolysaccharide export system permease protein